MKAGKPKRVSVYASSRARHCAIPSSLEMVGLSRFELLTPRLSSVCSNQLSYRPLWSTRAQSPHVKEPVWSPVLSKLDRTCAQSPVNTRSIFQVVFPPKGGNHKL